MENVLSGSADQNDQKDKLIGPFDAAREDALKFICGMQTFSTFQAIADRLALLDALTNMSLIKSGTCVEFEAVLNQHTAEIKEIESVIAVFCSLPDAPQA